MRYSLRRFFMRTVCIAAALGLTAAAAAAQGDPEMSDMVLGDGSQWRFLGGPFRVDEEGSIQHPETRDLHARAIFMEKAFSDVTVEFDYKAGYLEGGAGTAGLILRAPDGGRGYMVQFSWGGQTLRAKNFWAGLTELSGDGYLRHLKFDLVNGVPSETDRWYSVKVVAVGPRIRVWVDGCEALDFSDKRYSSGFLGLAGYGQYWFRNIRYSGTEVTVPPWDGKAQVRRSATVLPLPSDPINQGCVAPNGDVIIASGRELLRSTDGARTWTKEQLPDHLLDNVD